MKLQVQQLHAERGVRALRPGRRLFPVIHISSVINIYIYIYTDMYTHKQSYMYVYIYIYTYEPTHPDPESAIAGTTASRRKRGLRTSTWTATLNLKP